MVPKNFYRIRVMGRLGDLWGAWFEGLTLRHLPCGQTELAGSLDQAMLRGILDKIGDLGLQLVSLEQVQGDAPATTAESPSTLDVVKVFRWVSLATASYAALVILAAVIAYVPGHPGFSPFTTFLSDIGDTPGWPQVIFSSGTLIAAPLRYMVMGLLVLRLYRVGAGRAFGRTVLTVYAFGTVGTVLMTAVPFSVGPNIHMMGIPLYFLGVVPLQVMIGIRELTLKRVPRYLPALSFVVAGAYLGFFVLMVLYEMGIVSRTTAVTPMPWEWVAIAVSIAWLFAHGLSLGRELDDR
jgi:hypothetical protein